MTTDPLPIIHLGAKAWVCHQPQKAYDLGVRDLEYLWNPENVRILQQKAILTQHELRISGQNAIKHYCELRPLQREIILLQNSTTVARKYRSIHRSSCKIDGTMVSRPANEQWFMGFTSSNNSNWLDVCMFTGLQLKVAQLSVDQLQEQDYYKIPAASRVFHIRMMMTEWAQADQLTRDSVRDSIRSSLYLHNRTTLGERVLTHSCSVAETVRILFAGIPQALFSTTTAYRCCDGILVAYDSKERLESHSAVLQVTNPIIKEQDDLVTTINTIMFYEMQFQVSCTRGKYCTRKGYRVSLVLDQLPFTLFVDVTKCNIAASDYMRWRFFDQPFQLIPTLTIKYQDLNIHTETQAVYELDGVIFQNGSNNFVRWRHAKKPEWIEFDNVRYGARAVAGMMTLGHLLSSRAVPAIMVFRRRIGIVSEDTRD